jgi:hypothetical protein
MTRITIQLLLLPLLALILPMVFAMAWLHEAVNDLSPRGGPSLGS